MVDSCSFHSHAGVCDFMGLYLQGCSICKSFKIKPLRDLNRKKIECHLVHLNPGLELPNLSPQTIATSDPQLLLSLWNNFPFLFRIQDRKPGRPSLLAQVFEERGWVDYGESGRYAVRGAWNLWWRSSANKESFKSLQPWQTTNHLFKGISFCRKDVLARNLKRLHKTFNFNGVCDFSPKSYNFPGDYTSVLKRHTRRQEFEDGKPIWIAKPIGKSQGKGIVIFDNPSNFGYDDRCVVQEYIRNPLLIDGYKWDLRLYVCVTCQNPLTIYAYTEGITRFATKKYNLDELSDIFSHLTNTSLNKGSPLYKKNKSTIGVGSKWTLGKLRSYLKSQGIQDFFMWQKIWSILILTIIGHGKIISNIDNSQSNSFEFLGFDILIDDKLKPHLLEVNTSPALSCDVCTAVDETVKKPMLHELFDLLGLPDGRAFLGQCGTQISLPSLNGFPFKDTKESLLDKLSQSVVGPLVLPCPFRPNTGSPRCEDPTWLSTFRKDWNNNDDLGSKTASTYDGLPQDSLFDNFHQRNASSAAGRFERGECEVNSPWGCRSDVEIRDGLNGHKCELVGSNCGSWKKGPSPGSPVLMILPSVTTRSSHKDQVRCQFPTNGPGITLQKPDWSRSPSQDCGKWIRIFPFNNVTRSKAGFQPLDASRIIINQVAEYLKVCKDVADQMTSTNINVNDEEIESALRQQGMLNTTAIWYPKLG